MRTRQSKCLHNHNNGTMRQKYLYYIGYVMLAALTLFFCWLFCLRWGVFGAKVDWISQHSVIPDYFRKQFYATGKLFPEFAMNLGGGQNIYNYSYYGLYSPLFLVSYALPFVKMSTYVIVMEIVCLMASVLLLYLWLCRKGFGGAVSFMTAVVFLLTGPMICQSYSQIMFVNYMPFLILALLGVDRYFEKSRSGLLAVSTFLMIMTSFYFSIGGMLALVIYGIHCYGRKLEKQGTKATVKGFLCEGVRFLVPMFIAVLMSGVLLVPTALALIGRSSGESSGGSATAESLSALLASGNVTKILKGLFFPKIRLSGVFYSPYGLGFGTLMLTVLIATMFRRKWSDCIMAWLVAIVAGVPIFVYILNGGLYLRDKALIPLIPIFGYMLAMYLKRMGQKSFSWFGCIPYVVTMWLIYIGRNQENVEHLWPLLMIESQIMFGCYLAAGMIKEICQNSKRINQSATCTKTKDRDGNIANCMKIWGSRAATLLLAGSMAVFLAVFDNQYAEEKQEMLDPTFYEQVTDQKIGDAVQKATDEAKKDGGFYRTVQLGNDDENAANLNRVWNIDQNISSIYSSSYNKAYQNFRKDTFGLEQPYRNFLMQSEESNPIYERFMGEKYIVTKSEMTGCRLLEKSGEWNIYENENAAPVIYGTSRLMSEKEYKKLEYPYNQTTLLKKAVVPENTVRQTDNGQQTDDTVKQTDNGQQSGGADNVDCLHNVALRFGENSCISEVDGGYHISARKDTKVKAEIVSQIDVNSANTKNDGENTNVENEAKTASGNKVLLLRFKVRNLKPEKDLTIWVNGDRNKLSAKQRVYYNNNTTFTYAVALDSDENQVEVTFSKGKYNLSDMEAYIETMPGTELYESEFLQNNTKTKGNVIAGNLTMQKDGYLITSIPYDSGFKIQIDGKAVKSEKVNTAFLGCKMKAGEHDIVITYHAPGLAAGKMMSLAGVLGFLVLFLSEQRESHKKIRQNL